MKLKNFLHLNKCEMQDLMGRTRRNVNVIREFLTGATGHSARCFNLIGHRAVRITLVAKEFTL